MKNNTNDHYRFEDLPDEKMKNQEYRGDYRRDYARVIHSAAFRRLQHKTQLFPGQENDFFRNRLTHSLEVAQIAKSIALKLNFEHPKLPGLVEPDVCEIAGLVHDMGHPPFGHNGEKALNRCMEQHGGFEGNAPTLRIITRLEKTEDPGEIFDGIGDKDKRSGLNLTARVIASALKYDMCIPEAVGENVVKGYYISEKPIVDKVKELFGSVPDKKFKTVECSIMDLADDIAYSTYDIEDAFKTGFLSPLEMIAVDDSILEQIVKKLEKDNIPCNNIGECRRELVGIFEHIWKDKVKQQRELKIDAIDYKEQTISNFREAYNKSEKVASDGYKRTAFTSKLVNDFINGIKFVVNEKNPILSTVEFMPHTLLQVNILKHFAYVSLINSPRLKVAENRGEEIVQNLFNKLKDSDDLLLPDDHRKIYKNARNKWRVICDFIAGMTDRYALEFYGRLFSENPQSIFKPL